MKKSSTTRFVVWLVVAAAVVSALAVAFRPQKITVETFRAARGEVVVSLEHQGKTRVRDRYEIRAPVAGRILRVELEPGDLVVGGATVLAIIEASPPVPLDARYLAEAEARIAEAMAGLEQANANERKAETIHRLAVDEWEREELLVKDGASSEAKRASASTNAASAKESLEAARSAVRRAEYLVTAARARVLPAEGDSYEVGEQVKVVSPIGGTVLARHLESSSIVRAGEKLIDVAELDKLEVVADFISSDAVGITAGDSALIERWGGERSLGAVVRLVEPAGFMKLSALGVEEQRVNVILDFVDPSSASSSLGDAFRVEVRVIIAKHDDVLRVPTSSLFRAANGWALFVAEQDVARKTHVEIGARNARFAEIRDGLSEGMLVIAHPPNDLEDGSLLGISEE